MASIAYTVKWLRVRNDPMKQGMTSIKESQHEQATHTHTHKLIGKGKWGFSPFTAAQTSFGDVVIYRNGKGGGKRGTGREGGTVKGKGDPIQSTCQMRDCSRTVEE